MELDQRHAFSTDIPLVLRLDHDRGRGTAQKRRGFLALSYFMRLSNDLDDNA